MSLYPDQVKVAEDFEEWLNSTDGEVSGLFASAGFGKSFSVKHLIDEVVLKNSNYEPVLASMTHSAVDVLSNFVGREVFTLHSLLGWVPTVNKDTGEEGLSTPRMRDRNAEPRLKAMMLLVVDEAGLIGHDELALLLSEVRETGARVLFVGDSKQCFPVVKEGQEMCIPAYEYTKSFGKLFELTIPKRVDEGDMIYKLSLAYRAAVSGARQPKLRTVLNTDNSGKGVRHVDDIEEFAYKAFEAGKRDGNMQNIKVLAYTNNRCLSLNKKIRKRVMGLTDPTPIVGEEMIANTTISMAESPMVLIRNNQKLIVKSVEKTEIYGLKGAFIQYANLEGEDLCEIVFVPESPKKLNDRLKALANDAKKYKANGDAGESSKQWRNFFSLKDSCADIRFTYAMTVNKAQGTTLKHVLIDLCDINGCRHFEQKVRMAYTAVSRATDYCTIEGELTR